VNRYNRSRAVIEAAPSYPINNSRNENDYTMADDKQRTEVFKMASGDVSVWVDGGIHLKINAAGEDPVELGEQEALELGELLVRLAIEQRG
jgi:hypothetical protein